MHQSQNNPQTKKQVDTEDRFKFGANWKDFVKTIDAQRIKSSLEQIENWFGSDLTGKRFIDIGSGSGLHSLSAAKLGAQVISFDYDQDSVDCTKAIKEQYSPHSESWYIVQGSILDSDFVNGLGKFDITYSWGVLHHTGAMWAAIENAMSTVNNDGFFMIAIYNDQGWKSKFWWWVKKVYNILPKGLDKLYGYSVGTFFQLVNILKYTLLLKPGVAIKPLLNYKKNRGMSIFHDMIDWIGGFPFEVATYEKLCNYFESNGFTLIKGKRALSLGCHEMLFKKLG